MKYRPYWQRIIILAVIFNVILLLASSSIWSLPKAEEKPLEDLQEIEWVETEEIALAERNLETSTGETFPEIVMPPLEIPQIEFPPLPELKTEPPPTFPPENKKIVEKPPEIENKLPKKKEVNPEDKLKVIVKVYPKDLIEQLTATGVVKEKLTLTSDKVVLAVTITTEGKVRNVEIRQGGGNDERGKLIDFVSKTAAQSWIFEPYLDAEGNPQELKTQIEFKAEDF